MSSRSRCPNSNCAARRVLVRSIAPRKVSNTQLGQVAGPPFALDREVEACGFQPALGEIQTHSNCPEVLQSQRDFLPDQSSL